MQWESEFEARRDEAAARRAMETAKQSQENAVALASVIMGGFSKMMEIYLEAQANPACLFRDVPDAKCRPNGFWCLFVVCCCVCCQHATP